MIEKQLNIFNEKNIFNKKVNMNMIKDNIKKILADISYYLYQHSFIKMNSRIQVMSIDETIDELINTNKSLARFGDGELLAIRGGNLYFQDVSGKLTEDLKRIIKYEHENLLVSIQDIFNGVEQYVPESQMFWKDHLLFYRKYYEKYCNSNKRYASTSFSRCYITIQDKSKCREWFKKIKQIWNGKNIVIVEGGVTHNGVGNDLFEDCKSIQRIICPSTNAYSSLEKILDECRKQSKEKLFLVTLGPTAKPIVEKLFLEGYRAIDIGQIDTEYELFLMNAEKKQEITKHRAITIEENRKMGFDTYLSEVIARVEN